MNQLKKEMKFCILAIFSYISFNCATAPSITPPTISAIDNLNPSSYKIAVLPTLNNNNPEKKVDYGVTQRFQGALQESGFRVVNYQIVEAMMRELYIDPTSPLSISQQKQLQQKLNADALCLSSIENTKIPARGTAYGNTYGSGAGVTGEFYAPNSETLSIIDVRTFEEIMNVYIQRSAIEQSMSADIAKSIKQRFGK